MTLATFPEDFQLQHAIGAPVAEKILLPSIDMNSCERFIPFPVAAENLVPVPLSKKTQRLPRVSLFSTKDKVVLNGFRLYEADGKFFTDASLVSSQENSARQVQSWRTARRVPEDMDVSMLGSHSQTIRIERDGPILLPQSDEPSNFGSWLFRFLPKLLLTKSVADNVSVLAYVKPGWTKAIIDLVGANYDIIPHNPTSRYLISNPLIPSLAVPNVLFRAEALSLMWGLIDDNETISLGEKLYVSRLGQTAKRPQHRNLVNEKELFARLEVCGFREFRPENYSISQQMSIFSKAKVIIGLGGSNMFGSIFAKNAELIIDIESGDEWMFAHSNLLSSLPSHFSIVKGTRLAADENTPHVNWIVDIDSLLAGLSQLGVC
jgi:capsular polysaccharide biosynthesis protein